MVRTYFRTLTATVAAVGVLSLLGCSTAKQQAAEPGDLQESVTSPSEVVDWPLGTDAQLSGAPAWERGLSDEWRPLDGSDVFRNGLCRVTLQDEVQGLEIVGDEAGTAKLIDSVRGLYEEVSESSDVDFTEGEPQWVTIDDTPAEFATVEFTYTANASYGEQEWTALYVGRAFDATQSGVAALAECQGAPLTDSDRSMLEDVLSSLTVTTD